MKWFRHMSAASDDEFISGIEDEFGWEGYGRWWKLLEIIAKQMDETDRCYAEYSWVKWQSSLKGKRNKLETFLVHCQNKRKIKLEQTENVLKIICPKLLELRDNYTKDLQASEEVTSKQEVDVEEDNKVSGEEPPIDFKKLFFTEGLRMLGGESNRSLIGRWLRDYGEEAVASAFMVAQKTNAFDPKSYIIKLLKEKSNANTGRNYSQNARPNKTERLEAAARRAAESGGFAPRPPSEAEIDINVDASVPSPKNLRQGT